MDHLQTLQNVPARLLTGSSRMGHITLILSSSHWLPIKFRLILRFLFLPIEPCTIRHLSILLTCSILIQHLQQATWIFWQVPAGYSRTSLKTKRDQCCSSRRIVLCGLSWWLQNQPKISLFKVAFGSLSTTMRVSAISWSDVLFSLSLLLIVKPYMTFHC